MSEEVVIIPNVTRFNEYNIHFVVKGKVSKTKDKWHVLQSVPAGSGSGFRSGPPKIIILTGDQIRELLATCDVNRGFGQIDTMGKGNVGKINRPSKIAQSRVRIARHRTKERNGLIHQIWQRVLAKPETELHAVQI